VILDIGANVGNHTVYWGKITNVKKIYSFEPVRATFFILSRNIEINFLQEKVKLYNRGLSDAAARGKIEAYHPDNIGGTGINKGEDGDIALDALDNLREIREEPSVDFVKIDVEGREKDVLNGGAEFFKKHRPIVFIESFAGENQYDFVYNFFKTRGYNEPQKYEGDNYLFTPCGQP
jgi:FkbM family methyltransferase